MFKNKLMRIYGRRGENNKMEETTQVQEFKTHLRDSIRNAGPAYLIHISSTFPQFLRSQSWVSDNMRTIWGS